MVNHPTSMLSPLRRAAVTLAAVGFLLQAMSAMALDLAQSPLFLTQAQPPQVLLTMARDHRLFYEAYNDYSDLNDDGVLDIGYRPAIDYYGYFDSYKCYTYSSVNSRFEPSSVTADKKCSGQWSGDFLNYVTMSRMDALRKVLYGGKRSTDSTTETVLERSFIPQDAHAWGKEYESVARDGFDITEYTPLSLPASGTRHLLANVTLTSDASPPLMRVLVNSAYRVWEWVSIERPVAGTKCMHGGSGPDCVTAGGDTWSIVPGSGSHGLSGLNQTIYTTNSAATIPSDHATYDTFVTTHGIPGNQCGTRSIGTVNGSGNPFAVSPCNTSSNYYLNIVQGTLNISTAGTYEFAVDGDDAVEVIIDGTVVASWYDGHGSCNCNTHSGSIILSAGAHTIEFRHMEKTGGDSYYLRWKRTVPASTMTDYTVKVKVCDSTVGLETNCQGYGSSPPVYKPIGLIQTYGQNNGMFFGLLTGSYAHNTDGGVLRRAMSTINDEIMADGRFGSTTDTCASGRACANGVLSTLNKLMIKEFNYGDYSYNQNCGWITTTAMTDGQCRMWGNPIAEMMYEGLRYFAGKASATSAFTYSGTTVDSTLGLPQLTTWINPYASSPNMPGASGYNSANPDTYPSCAKPYMMMVSDVYPSFDSDSLPGSYFNSGFTGDLSGLNVETRGNTIWNQEFGSSTTKNVFIGQSGATSDSAPTPKSVTSFGNIRGLAPADPTRQGSYYAASVAYHGHITDLNAITGSQKLNAYSVALAAPLPTIIVPIGSNAVTIVPFAKSVGQDSTSWVSNAFLPTNQIVDFYIDTIRNVPGYPTDASFNGGRGYYKFRINYEDVEQGADHDMDAIAVYEIKVNADDTVSVIVTSEYAAGGIKQHMGFVASGTTRDGTYLVARDVDTGAGSDYVYALDCRSSSTSPFDCVGVGGSGDLPLVKELIFTPSSSSSSAIFLKDPLWYAAKWGGFVDDNGNDLPDSTEWDADGDGVPDNYFLVTNPLKMEQQLSKALAKIKDDSGTAASLSTNSFSFQSDTKLFQARFSSDGWSGEMNAYPVLSDGTLGPPAWQAQTAMASQSGSSRVILTYDPGQTGAKGIPFQWGSMTTAGTLQTQLNKTAGGTVDSLGSDRVSFLRGDVVSGMRTRPYVKGTTTTNKLGDIISSQPQYVAKPNFGYGQASYAAFSVARENRDAIVYAGANDGMLYGFDAASGTARISYVPSEMYRTRNSEVLLSKLTQANYGKSGNAHHYYVDGSPTVGDICSSPCTATTDWKTILVGGLNAGGQGIYALNITDPDDFLESNAGSVVMWEYNDWQDTDSDADKRYALGYTYSRPAIVRVCSDRDNSSSASPKVCTTSQWAVIFGNGYNNSEADGYASTSGHAVLYVLNAHTGAVLKKINTESGTAANPNGLSTVSPIDVDEDGVVDYVFAGDLQGQIWKFDLTDDNMSNWDSDYSASGDPAPLYTAYDEASPKVRQPITTPPDVIIHPNGGYMVVFGTGQYIATSDKTNTQVQTAYGIWDNGATVSSTNRSNLQQQTMTSAVDVDGIEYRTVSSNAIDWSTKKGWYINLPDSGERVAFEPRVFGSLFYFTSMVPSSDICSYGGYSWDNFVDALTGARLSYSPFDGLPQQNFGSLTAYASGRKSTVGITPTGTIITEGKGRGTMYQGGSTGEIDKYKVSLGSSLAGRISWREILGD